MSSLLQDDFLGDDRRLVDSIEALLDMDKRAVTTHPIPGHARQLLSAAGSRLKAQQERLTEHADTSLNERIERLAKKHVCPYFGKIGPAVDYQATEQFRRLQAFTVELLMELGLQSYVAD